jgi:hypothetical protein
MTHDHVGVPGYACYAWGVATWELVRFPLHTLLAEGFIVRLPVVLVVPLVQVQWTLAGVRHI